MTSTVLTRDERTLLAAVSKHRRTNGWRPVRGGFRHEGAFVGIDWHEPWLFDGHTGHTIVVRLLDRHLSTRRVCHEVDVDSVQEAVDVAVLAGVLPAAFSSTYRAGLAAAEAVLNTPGTIPAVLELALLRQARDEDSLDVTDDELLDHHRTDPWRSIIHACWTAAQAHALGWEVATNGTGTRLVVLDRIDAEGDGQQPTGADVHRQCTREDNHSPHWWNGSDYRCRGFVGRAGVASRG